MSGDRRVLVVDDDAGVVDYLVEMLDAAGYRAEGVTSGPEALARIRAAPVDLLVVDLEMPEMRGTDLMAAIHAERPSQLVLLMTAFGSIDTAVAAVRAGAADFVTKPFKIEVLYHAIERAFRDRAMRREIVRLRGALPESAPGEVVARSPAMRRVLELARRAARSDYAVLLTGESGTGKGVIARFLHGQSERRERSLVQVNCAALPAPLVESELFGVRRGAFTDAREDRPGLFEQASGGTLFLDEVAEMPLEAQPKLLQALETGRVRPVGGGAEVAVDVRVVAATNRPLEDALRERRFRPDLYYRLNVLRIDVPPLRERPEDVEALVDVFLHRASASLERAPIGVTAGAMRWLVAHRWPGNVRELANTIQRAAAMTDHDAILLEDLLSIAAPGGGRADTADLLSDAAARFLPLAEVEKTYIRKVLEATDNNKSRAARLLGIDRRTLYRKVGDD